MTTIFVSYRRSDATATAGRVADRLRAHPTGPTIFFDTDAIGPGDPWRKRIDAALAACDVMLVVLGPRWLAVESPGARPRIFDPDDVVAYEINAALARGIRIVPLLVDGATLPTGPELPAPLATLLDSNALEIRNGAFDRDVRALEGAILPPVPGRRGLWAAVAALVVAVAVGVGWFVGTPGKLRVGIDKPPPPAAVAVDVDLGFVPHAAMERIGVPASSLALELEKPEPQGPLLFLRQAASAADALSRFVHKGLHLPPPDATISGTLVRDLADAVKTTPGNLDAIYTHLCLDVTKEAAPADRRLRLTCSEGKRCETQDAKGIVAPCGAGGKTRLRLPDLIPSAMAQATGAAAGPQAAGRPAPGDWLVPRIDSLRERRGTPRAAAFSEVLLTLDLRASAPSADEITYELKVNGRRLWVNGLAPWTHAVPLKAGTPVQLAFGLENLDASGADHGRERLEVRIVQLARKRSVAEDSVTLDFVALRDLDERPATTAAGVPLRWSARYYPAAADRYQVFAYGGGEADTLDARTKFDAARAPASAAAGALPLVGVVRPPTEDGKAWGVAVGVAQPTGQVRFSFDADAAKALCAWMNQPGPARRLAAKGFPPPATFGVREIAVETNDAATRKPTIKCSRFAAS